MNRPDVTIVICTYNRAERLPAALGSLCALELAGRTAEILVVDNASNDDTGAVVAELAAWSTIPMRCVHEAEQGIVPARNRGVAAARGKWIAFFDDDQLAEPDWITELFALAERRHAACVGGAVRLNLPEGHGEAEDLSPVVRMLLGETVDMHRERPYNRRVTPGCGNLMVRRDVFEEIGRFDPAHASRGEDTDLWLRMDDAGIAGWFTPRAVIRHVIPAARMNDDYLLRLALRMSEGMAESEQRTWGPLYPLVWLARVGQLVIRLWPRWAWARWRGNPSAMLGANCRLSIATRVLRNGWKLMTARKLGVPSEPGVARAQGTGRTNGGNGGSKCAVAEQGLANDVDEKHLGCSAAAGVLEHANTGDSL